METFFDNYYVYSSYIPTDIYPVQSGSHQCDKGYSFGPCVRNNYLIHYVYSGKGIFRVDGKEYNVHSGQMFLIKPNQLAFYRADNRDAWLYRWIEFNGSMSEKILAAFDSPILDDSGNIGNALKELAEAPDTRFEAVMQKFWAFIATLTHAQKAPLITHGEEYVSKAVAYIKNNVHKKISVSDIADHIGINRSYLSRLFREYKGVSPQQYISTIKMNAAVQYLKNTNVSVGEVAKSVGYDDYHVFNKVFRNHFGVAPSIWKKKQFWEQSLIE